MQLIKVDKMNIGTNRVLIKLLIQMLLVLRVSSTLIAIKVKKIECTQTYTIKLWKVKTQKTELILG
jgi:hypothetical protein